ncbi:hypothetical protein N480_01330 [Pseudoalteromonas luteoviolacea S2607]|uniref:hypothetical protein n=1 Tax=Pseudoalteromonas luteoviolacea TaxID=43657 RepID=UPI0007B0A21D|nr:hypothetical protein [Pseudoalteromonas luteoviolacea]KZN39505.1 hypothetical protein N480_01330 [Pseudoalteromonas luteoviolacea S2607]
MKSSSEYTSQLDNESLWISVAEGKVASAKTTLDNQDANLFCEQVVGMLLADAAYYGAKTVLEQHNNNRSPGITFVDQNPTLLQLDTLIKKIFDDSTQPDSPRYVCAAQRSWAELPKNEQVEAVQSHLNDYFEGNSLYNSQSVLIDVKFNSIQIDLSKFVPKSQLQKVLVKLEKYLRESLGNIPVIVLIEEYEDANKKRQ